MKRIAALLSCLLLVLSVCPLPSLAYDYDPFIALTEPTDEPTDEPTAEPTDEPTTEPTEEPTDEPTAEPTEEPTGEPTTAPTEEPLTAHDLTLEVSRNVPAGSLFEVDNAEGATLTVTITSEPEKGSVTLGSGLSFTYTPELNKLHDDAFSYTVSDGSRTSNEATVTVDIIIPAVTPEAYYDLSYNGSQTHWAFTSAGSLAAESFIEGELVNAKKYFYPDKPVTRAEFVAFLNAIMEVKPSTEEASMFDDVKLPHQIAVLNAAKTAGFINGSPSASDDKTYFYPDRVINRAEAFVMINNALDVKSDNAEELDFSDKNLVPSWAITATKNMVGYAIAIGSGGKINPLGALTRAQAAELIWKTRLEYYEQLALA